MLWNIFVNIYIYTFYYYLYIFVAFDRRLMTYIVNNFQLYRVRGVKAGAKWVARAYARQDS